MRNLIAAVYFVLALFGCDTGGSTLVTRISEDGEDILYSRTYVKAGIARFECIASASGRCHYMLVPHDCASPAETDCHKQPIERFSMAKGESRELVGLARPFDICVRDNDAIAATGCATP